MLPETLLETVDRVYLRHFPTGRLPVPATPEFPATAERACAYCGCTEADACRLANGDPCSWFDQERTVCSRPACISSALRERGAAKAPRGRRPRKAGPR